MVSSHENGAKIIHRRILCLANTFILLTMPRELKPPFKFDIRDIMRRLQKVPLCVDGVTITLPFVEVSVKPDKVERKVAREIVIRLADRRVLNAFECCDNCIDMALKSLQEIREVIVEKQVELSEKATGRYTFFSIPSDTPFASSSRSSNDFNQETVLRPGRCILAVLKCCAPTFIERFCKFPRSRKLKFRESPTT